MRRYSRIDEETVRTERLIREWRRSGLLEAAQCAIIERGLSTGLRRTNFPLRAALFVFGCIVVASATGLTLNLLGMDNSDTESGALIVAAVVSFGIADTLAARFRLYRFGVEEAFVTGSIVLLGIGVSELARPAVSSHPGEFPMLAGLIAASIGALLAYLRFGYVYAAVGSLGCATLAFFQIGGPVELERGLAALALFGVFAGARKIRRPTGDDYPGDDYGSVQTAAWLGLYLVLNLQLSPGPKGPTAFYWGTYVMTWFLPAIGLFISFREKDRRMIQANAAMALATLITNKMYLGWERHAWDPIALGVLLSGTAVAIRRWLAKGDEGQRRGYTPLRVLHSDKRSLAVLSVAAGAVQPFGGAPAATPASPKFEPGGGGSGGGGAGGSF